jgi:hypothetical protein
VQRAFTGSIAGELPPDQCLPEVWVIEDAQCEPARALLASWQQLPHRLWACPACHEIVDGPFESAGTAAPRCRLQDEPHPARGRAAAGAAR